MPIKMKYAEVDLVFRGKSELVAWCDWHIEKLGNAVLSQNNQGSAAEVFQRLKTATGFEPIVQAQYGQLPPIRDEATGQFLYDLKDRDPDLFQFALRGWNAFGRGAINAHQRTTGEEAAQLAIITTARSISFPADAKILSELIARQTEAHAELLQTRETYEALMALKAPADYWRSKHGEHKANEENYLKYTTRCAGLFVFLSLLLPFLFVKFGFRWLAQASEGLKVPEGFIYYPVFGVFVLLVTTGLWGLRILVKLYLSEHHLRTDATERLTMIMTYLALTELNAADEKDRSIVLASIFRPTQDGVVKDEGVDPSLPHLISRAMAK